MKRFIAACLLLIGIFIFSCYVSDYIYNVKNEMFMRIDTIIEKINTNDSGVQDMINELHDFWETQDKQISSFVRHDYIERISSMVCYFPALYQASPEECVQLLLQIKEAVEHLQNAEAHLPAVI